MCLTVAVCCASLLGAQSGRSDPRPQSRPTNQTQTAAEAKPSPEVQRLLDRWAGQLRGLRTLRVEFTQTKHLRILRRPRVSRGTALLRGRRLLMTISDARGNQTHLLVENGEVRIHYPRLKKLEIYPADRTRKTEAPFPMVVDDVNNLPKKHEIALERDGEAEILVMTPRAADSKFREIRIRFEQGQMSRVEQTSRRGDRVVMAIEKFIVNPKISEAEVQLDVPKGTREVRFAEAKLEAGKKKQRQHSPKRK